MALTALAGGMLALAVLPGTAAATPKPVGSVYTETNGESANELLVYTSYHKGGLLLDQRIKTGGLGGKQPQPGCDPPDHKCPLLDSQGEVITSEDGSLVFAVNAGSNTITSFRVNAKTARVKKASTISSNGVFPNSLTVHENKLYVLNANSSSISGYTFTETGKMKAIAGSTQNMNPQAVPLARQIGFDNTGKVLIVSSLTDGRFDVFPVNSKGVAGPPTAQPSASPQPFAFSFDPKNRMFAVEVVNDADLNQSSNASSYSVSGSGTLTPISTVPTQGYAACWTQITENGKFLFVVNTGGPSPFGALVTTFSIGGDGSLTFVSKTPPEPRAFTMTDAALSADDKFLYVVVPLSTPSPFLPPDAGVPPAGSKILTYKVGSNGSLTKVNELADTEPAGMSGLAAN